MYIRDLASWRGPKQGSRGPKPLGITHGTLGITPVERIQTPKIDPFWEVRTLLRGRRAAGDWLTVGHGIYVAMAPWANGAQSHVVRLCAMSLDPQKRGPKWGPKGPIWGPRSMISGVWHPNGVPI